MPSYEAGSFSPPAPVARVILRSADQTTTVTDVPMILDTGADVSLVPRVATETLALPEQPAGRFQVVGFDGRSSTVPAFELEMSFAGRVFRGRFLLIDGDCGIILFDGPHLTWELHKPVET